MDARQGDREGGFEDRSAGPDPQLHDYLANSKPRVIADALRSLLEDDAAPIIQRVLDRAGASVATGEIEDVRSAAREQLIRQLAALRSGERTAPIRDFGAYVASVTSSTWAAHLRAAHPRRSMLLNRLRYLLENRTNQRGFALWPGAAGERWCGFADWPQQPARVMTSPKLQWLLLDPVAATRDAFGQHTSSMTLPDFVAGIFGWLGVAIELNSLAHAAAVALDISDSKTVPPDDVAGGSLAHGAWSPSEALKWQEYLRWLWLELGKLSLPQRTAFLLHADITIELDFVGVASIRQIAALLAIPAEEFAELWKALPLADLVIASRLALHRQQVINLRRVARDRLGVAWKEWINDPTYQ